MMDSVELLQFIKQNSTFADAKAIVFGGSITKSHFCSSLADRP